MADDMDKRMDEALSRLARDVNAGAPRPSAALAERVVDDAADLRVADGLAALGHALRRDVGSPQFGGAQILWPTADGVVGGSDRRKDGGVVS